jgi:hypothetical protein
MQSIGYRVHSLNEIVVPNDEESKESKSDFDKTAVGVAGRVRFEGH